ncbi:MAG: Serine/threonine phosphatase stp [Syntrophomonadaceae bacterium]|nr:Serine/threonine phosphatase stp [Bacillota bacterium]
MKAAGMSDRGRVREKNEDAYLLMREGPVCMFAVADGMGGHAAGEVASTLALQVLESYLQEKGGELLERPAALRYLTNFMEEMGIYVNSKVLETARQNTLQAGMGTTLTMLLGVNGLWCLGHIGDSRAYLINGNGLYQLTEDHTLVTQLVRSGQLSDEDTESHPQRHVLTRALGTDEQAAFDILPQSFRNGDIVLLCSDGLHCMLDNLEIASLVRSDSDPGAALERLIARANEHGGTDNITGVLVFL